MKIGVVSDTHLPRFGERLPAELGRGLGEEGVALVLHLGDFTGPAGRARALSRRTRSA